MSEQYTPSPETNQQTPKQEQPEQIDNFAVIQEFQNNDAANQEFRQKAAQRARQFVGNESKPSNLRTKIIAVTATGALALGAGLAVAESTKGPEFAEESIGYSLLPGDGLYDAAEQVRGSDSVDIRDVVDHISHDPANIDVFKDGRLDPGEVLAIPTEVKN